MKKKLKLFTTIAALSLSLGLMVFGIWAAASVNVTISSNVSYTAEGVAFNLYGKSEALASQPTGNITDLTEETADQTLTVDVTNAGSGNMTLPDRDFSTTNTWVVYTFTIENTGSNVIGEVTVDATCSHANIALTQDDTSSITLNNGETASFRVYLHLTNENQTISSQPVEIEISLAEAVVYELRYSYTGGYDMGEYAFEGVEQTLTVNGDHRSVYGTNVVSGDVIVYSTQVVGENPPNRGHSAYLYRYNAADEMQELLDTASIPGDSFTYTVPDQGLNDGDYFLILVD